jgi:hypothetical protein
MPHVGNDIVPVYHVEELWLDVLISVHRSKNRTDGVHEKKYVLMVILLSFL